jgi:hypothetical protein
VEPDEMLQMHASHAADAEDADAKTCCDRHFSFCLVRILSLIDFAPVPRRPLATSVIQLSSQGSCSGVDTGLAAA